MYLFNLAESGNSENKTTEEDNILVEDVKQDDNKPVASVIIPDTQWSVVWTGDDKVFYFNPTTKSSVWVKPDELLDNHHVDEILATGPNAQPSGMLIVAHLSFRHVFEHYNVSFRGQRQQRNIRGVIK